VSSIKYSQVLKLRLEGVDPTCFSRLIYCFIFDSGNPSKRKISPSRLKETRWTNKTRKEKKNQTNKSYPTLTPLTRRQHEPIEEACFSLWTVSQKREVLLSSFVLIVCIFLLVNGSYLFLRVSPERVDWPRTEINWSWSWRYVAVECLTHWARKPSCL
jgi:hypothetical protein